MSEQSDETQSHKPASWTFKGDGELHTKEEMNQRLGWRDPKARKLMQLVDEEMIPFILPFENGQPFFIPRDVTAALREQFADVRRFF